MKCNFFKDIAQLIKHNDMITIDAVVPVHRFGTEYKQVSYWDRSNDHNVRYTTIAPMDKDINKGDVVSKRELLEEAGRLHNKIYDIKEEYEKNFITRGFEKTRDSYKKDFHDFVHSKETCDSDRYITDVEDVER